MRSIRVENLTDDVLNVAIEPWAHSAVMAPREKIEIEFSGDPQIEFSVVGSGNVVVGVMSDRVRILTKGEVGEYTSPEPGFFDSEP